MNANPAITTYYFYDSSDNQLQSGSSNTYVVTSSLGYQTYSCRAQNSRGLSEKQFLIVEEATDPPNIGAATENTGIGTGTIAAIVLGIIFLLLLIIIIIVCCCSYGWCRKKEKVEPQVIVEKPIAKPYIPRTIVSASSTVSRKDVGVMMNGYRDASVSTEFEEPRYTTPRYHLKPASNGGPIISMYDDGYEQPRAHQLPALDTQYLYTDTKPRKHKKKRRRRHEDVSPRRQHYEPEPEPDVRYAEAMPASDEDLVVVPGKQNYFE
ncbi:uncharacterized protein LOC128559963 isoform X1 [Mercenaria mercenaria]|uniref:uncharacterized protein LOC128559963 isoform X1 n=1 Tax=Mercenaria mercenaria TaxID=6596 RepID=UPI00234F569B|nr:uncharacterized protein LOC128559963 isoform X1 [Mercenaria mercenaria]